MSPLMRPAPSDRCEGEAAPSQPRDFRPPGHGHQVHLPALIADGLGIARSAARQLIDTNGVTLNGATLSAGEYEAIALDQRTFAVQWHGPRVRVRTVDA